VAESSILEASGESPLGQGVLRFLESLGQRSEAELYLRIFRGLPLGRFALIVVETEVIERRAGTLAEQLSFLRDLGLYPSLLLGAVDRLKRETLDQLKNALSEARLSYSVEPPLAPGASLSDQDGTAEIRVLSLRAPSDEQLAEVVSRVAPRKTLFLRRNGGLGPHGVRRLELSPGHFLQSGGSGISAINLRGDADELLASSFLSSDDRAYLSRARRILSGTSPQSRATVSVASPLSILRELFTVFGDGTLIKLGSDINRISRYEALDTKRLQALIEESFGRPVSSDLFHRTPERIYVESDYRGMALIEPGVNAAFLSKFAVLPEARGEGLGQDLFWAFSREHPRVYWRARPNNPINSWYRTVCDGMHRAGDWVVYFRGTSAEEVPALVRDAVERPIDLPG
jgi:GNAT superfamily N-acetyltransferase